MALREILFAEVKRPEWMATESGGEASSSAANAEENEDNNEEGPEVENEVEEEEEEEEDYGQVETYVEEQDFDFKGFVLKFAVRSVCSAYAHLFKDFRRNADFTNHCVVKMFHRIAYDCRAPALLFQTSVFRVFQQVSS